MGCDIHIILEHCEAGSAEWVGLWSSDRVPCGRLFAARRDYNFFAEVAQVRGSSETGVYPRNLPKDVSRLAWLQFMRAPTDHHSASHLSPAEFVAAFLRANPTGAGIRPDFALHDLLAIDSDDDGDHRVVFWFDN